MQTFWTKDHSASKKSLAIVYLCKFLHNEDMTTSFPPFFLKKTLLIKQANALAKQAKKVYILL